MKVELKKFDRSFLNYSWHWLNNPEIRELISSPAITKDLQLQWYRKIQELDDYLIWGLQVLEKPIGVCGIKNITNDDCEYWGYIGEKDYWGKGFGTQIMILMEDAARSRSLKTIWLQVNTNNIRAIRLYEKMNYKVTGKTIDKLNMRKVL